MIYQKKEGINDNRTLTDKRFSAGLAFFFVTLTLLMMTSSMTTTTIVYADKSSSNGGSGSSNPSSSNSLESSSSSGSSGSTATSDSDKDKDVDTSNTPPNNPDASTDTGTSSSSGSGSPSSGNTGSSSQQPAHCDRPGYPSCSSLGSQAAQNAAPGSSCPPGHSKAFCNAFNAATGASVNNQNINNQHNVSSAAAGSNASLLASQQAPALGNITCNSSNYNGTCLPTPQPTGNDAYIECLSAAQAADDLKGQLKCAALLPDTPENAYVKCVSAAMVVDDLKGQLKCASLLPDTGPNIYTKCVSAAMVRDDLKGQLKCAALLPDTPENAYVKCVSAAMVRDDLAAEIKCASLLRSHPAINPGGTTISPAITTIIPGEASTATYSTSGYLRQIPSNATDFPNNDPTVIQVHVTSAKKDITGSYHVTGEITNQGNDTLNSVLVTVHFYDASGNLIADSSCCYTNPINIDPGHTSTFDSFAQKSDLSGTPTAFRLSFDWS